MNNGTVAISVEAIPTVVYWKANKLNETPRNGPKNEPINKGVKALLFFKEYPTDRHCRAKVMITTNPMIPVRTLICVDENGS